MEPNERKLYQQNTYAPTVRLEALREGTEFLTKVDVLEFLHELQDGQEGWGDGTRNVTLQEFGAWLLGNKDPEFREYAPAEITW